MNLNVIFTGQSNFSREYDNGTLQKVIAQAQTMLGFDGTTNTITLLGSDSTTAVAGTQLLGASNEQAPPWLAYVNGTDTTGGLARGSLETTMFNYISGLPAATKASPTMVIFMHNESDTSNLNGLSVSAFEAAIRYQRADIDAALGQSASAVTFGMAFVPYDFLTSTGTSAYALLGLVGNSQNAQVAEQALAADPGFNGVIAAHMNDADMNGTDPTYGGQHFSSQDQSNYSRFARAIAGNFAAYAQPGSPVALANGAWDFAGPQVSAAAAVSGNVNQLLLTIALAPGSNTLVPPNYIGATGAGFSMITGTTVNAGVAASVVDATHLLVTFASPVQTDGTASLHIGYGVGRIALNSPPEGPGFGGGIYDNIGLPLWADPNGVAVTALSGASSVFGPTGSQTIYTGNGADTVSAGSGSLNVFAPASGTLTFLGGSGHSTVTAGAGGTTAYGGAGTLTLYGGSGSVTAYGGLGGNNTLLAGSGNNTLVGGGSGDSIVGGSGNNVLTGGLGNENIFANGMSTVFGGAGLTTVVDGSGTSLVVAGSGTLAYFGGAGTYTVYGGTGPISFTGGKGSLTLTGGNNTNYVGIGPGAMTMVEGASTGTATYAVTKGSSGGAATIFGFRQGTDKITLNGFGSGEASNALGTAVAAGGNLTLTLSDNTRMTFVGMSSLSPQSFL